MLNILVDLQHNQIMRLYARALKAKRRPKYSLGIICQWIGGLVNSPLLARPAYGSFALCSKDESGTASRTKPFISNSWRYFSELRSVLDTTFIGAMHRIGEETSFLALFIVFFITRYHLMHHIPIFPLMSRCEITHHIHIHLPFI